MSDFKMIETSAEVYAVIMAKHRRDLKVFLSYSAPNGPECGEFGDPTKGVMQTAWGFNDSDCPIVFAETTWDLDREAPSNRANEQHNYWLCVPEVTEA